MTDLRRAVGDYGESLACRYLTENGLVVMARNWRCARGEIDIVAVEGDVLVVCEVKTRRGDTFGAPFEAVGPVKLRRLRSLAMLWLDEQDGPDGRPWYTGLRVDVVSIRLRPGSEASIEHLVGVG